MTFRRPPESPDVDALSQILSGLLDLHCEDLRTRFVDGMTLPEIGAALDAAPDHSAPSIYVCTVHGSRSNKSHAFREELNGSCPCDPQPRTIVGHFNSAVVLTTIERHNSDGERIAFSSTQAMF